jgi:hypothetical protein
MHLLLQHALAVAACTCCCSMHLGWSMRFTDMRVDEQVRQSLFKAGISCWSSMYLGGLRLHVDDEG